MTNYFYTIGNELFQSSEKPTGEYSNLWGDHLSGYFSLNDGLLFGSRKLGSIDARNIPEFWKGRLLLYGQTPTAAQLAYNPASLDIAQAQYYKDLPPAAPQNNSIFLTDGGIITGEPQGFSSSGAILPLLLVGGAYFLLK